MTDDAQIHEGIQSKKGIITTENNPPHIQSGSQQSQQSHNEKYVKTSAASGKSENNTIDQGSLKTFGFADPIHGKPESFANDTSNSNHAQESEDNSGSYYYGMETVTSESLQNTPKVLEDFNPIVSIEDFFGDDMPLPGHSLHESPCYPIINTKSGETPTQRIYYCELHPDLGSTFLSEIEFHCRQKDAESHKAAILAKGESL